MQYDLDEIWFLPNGNPPHKQGIRTKEQVRHRVRMVEAAIRSRSSFRLSLYEVERREVSYSYATMEHFRQVYPEHRFYFIIGADSLMTLEFWKNPERLFRTCVLLAACRDDVDNLHVEQKIQELHRRYRSDIRLLTAPRLPISSHEIRSLLAEGKLEQASQFIPPAVTDYIRQHGLYQRTEG